MFPLNALLTLLCIESGIVFSHEGQKRNEGKPIQQYAAHHMATEHHMSALKEIQRIEKSNSLFDTSDTFDTASFFQLHDLNRDGFLDTEEIEAIYGVHHAYSQQKSKDDEEHSQKAQTIVTTILAKMDANKDGKISLEEFERQGLDALPDFNHLGAEGHHYDMESEFFLHHEDMYHATPETQTDDSYNHPEDLEHFDKHESIEAEEQRRERKFTGLSEEEMAELLRIAVAHAQKQQGKEEPPFSSGEIGSNETVPKPIEELHVGDQQVLQQAVKPKFTREVPPEELEPAEKYADALKDRENQPEWGRGKDGYKRPKTPADKMRRNLPYKYKFRRNWGDF